MRQVAVVARRREFDGEKVPNGEKVFSIFEPHTELIMRGRRGRPVEFGHKVLLTQSKEKFITDYVVLEENRSDDELLPMVLERHEEKYGRPSGIGRRRQGFLPGRRHVRRVGGAGRLPGRASPDPRFRRRDDGRLAAVASRDRGHDLVLKTGISAGPMLFSRI